MSRTYACAACGTPTPTRICPDCLAELRRQATISQPTKGDDMRHELDRVQSEFADRLSDLFEHATNLLPAERIFEAALGTTTGFAARRSSPASVALTLRAMADAMEHEPGALPAPGAMQ